MASGMVKTYRVLRDGLKVGHDIRNFGDYMPEAAEFSNLRSLLNADFLEEVWVEEAALEDWKKEYAQRSLDTEADEDEDEGTTEPDSDEAEVVTEPKKKSPKKKAIKKTVKKTRVKENGNALTEHSV